ncbi:putative colanic acid biosynthesis UDP-glucose lipid carrier transferase [Dyadobacter jejuensis]|uniref:Putative colanic acid biosynthesis UDP-glucose lipid carrier transferase n=1 Tax=Dyadobacter jejuensis TaxID=1082580 RepID=A0A316AF35_9BACT|nr:exopolysaccharide biosynthesis polyprenyl glycosylphosphotransferase [Dyadobacter jejuensis]PWJ55979.1 putative colanic acid biosynthesis UDP-glucose lipid carrier transferase [Dyadobacter jejuensis]
MKNRLTGLLPKVHLWTDLVLLNVSFFLAYALRFETLPHLIGDPYVNMLLVANLLWILCSNWAKTYHFTRLSYHFNIQITSLLKTAVVHAGLLMAFMYLAQVGELYSRSQVSLTYGLFILVAAIARAFTVSGLKLYRQAGYNYNRYIIIGNGELSSMIRGFYNKNRELGYRFYGAFPFSNDGEQIARIEQMIKEQKLDYVYCCMSDLTDDQVSDLIRLGERHRTQIRLVPDFRGFVDKMANIEYHDLYPVIQVNTKPFSNVQEQSIKRVFDLAFSGVVMILGAPLFLLLMLVVKLSSPGPIFFRQKRSGRWGEIFEIYKFRSMYVDADKMGLQHSQGDDDPRITPVGKILRKTRLDELPQFFNVLKGDMSVVGPRPLYKYDVDMLMEAEPHDFQRLLTVKPGITSIGQINVGYADTVAKNVERLRYDVQYLKSYSLLDDIKLIFKTVQVMVLGRGQ